MHDVLLGVFYNGQSLRQWGGWLPCLQLPDLVNFLLQFSALFPLLEWFPEDQDKSRIDLRGQYWAVFSFVLLIGKILATNRSNFIPVCRFRLMK